MSNEVYYFIGPVRTKFDEWLGCATKFCKGHKKNPNFCHIRPETPIFPIGNGLYECIECYNQMKNSRQGIFWTLRDTYPKTPPIELMSEDDVIQLRDNLAAIRESEERHPVPPELTREEEKQRHKARQLKRSR